MRGGHDLVLWSSETRQEEDRERKRSWRVVPRTVGLPYVEINRGYSGGKGRTRDPLNERKWKQNDSEADTQTTLSQDRVRRW
jgi:hypothetical protein